MITLRAHMDGLEETIRSLGLQAKQVSFATSLALNWSAKDVRADAYKEMRAKFDRPTPMTMRSLFIKPAKKDNLEATVWLKDQGLGANLQGSGTPLPGDPEPGSMAAIIGHQFRGGLRVAKGMEVQARAKGILDRYEFLVPTEQARIDRYGNMSRGQVQQIYAALALFFDTYNNASDSQRSRRNARKAGRLFWSGGPGVAPYIDRPKGVWAAGPRGSAPKLIMAVVTRPIYRKLIDLDDIGARTLGRVFPAHFQKALEQAARTAR